MSGRTVRRFVDGLLRGRAHRAGTPRRIRSPRDEDGDRIARRPDRQRLAARGVRHRPASPAGRADGRGAARRAASSWGPSGTRRQVVIGTGLAAASAATGIVVGRNLLAPTRTAVAGGTTGPGRARIRTQAAGVPSAPAPTCPKGGALAFDLGSVSGFVHRADAQLEAVSGICTHQGCKLWLDAPESRLRCPCHSTSFSLEGETLTHQLPTAPPPLPKFEVREINGVIEVFAPTEPA